MTEIKIYTKTILVEAAQFSHANPDIPGVERVPDSGPLGQPLPDSFWVTDMNSESWRLKDGDWVVWDPLRPGHFAYYEDERFQNEFKEVK